MKIKSFLISTIITVIIATILNYLFLPAWNIHSVGMWIFIIVCIVILISLNSSISCLESDIESTNYGIVTTIGIITIGAMLMIMGIALIGSSVFFNATSYSNLITLNDGVWSEDMEPVDNVSHIALMDSETATVFGERALGELSALVSQYDLSNMYTQVNITGRPMKISILEYENFWKWNKNKINGIPGYVLVDPVENTAEYIEFKEGVKYSHSERFSRDLNRHLRNQYPSALFAESYFEVDDDMNPYWITSVYKTTIGLFGGKIITDVIITDAITGKSEMMSVEDAPTWVDVIFDGDYISERLDWNGTLKNGFWNSVFSGTGCTKCTDDYGYVTIGDDIWMYTGITSISGDSSNIGVVLANERTCEIKYYSISGADEKSAMAAAQGEVQQYGYVASFPSIINVNGEPTYIMVLKDANNIVKNYAMVNVKNYTKVVVAETQEEVFAEYAKKMGFKVEEPIVEEKEEVGNLIDVNFVVSSIQYIVNNGNTTVYITTNDGKVYKSKFDEFWILVKESDEINAQYAEKLSNDDIILLNNYYK